VYTLLRYRLENHLTPYQIYIYTPELALETENLMAIIDLESEKAIVENEIAALPIRSRHELAINGKQLMAHTSKRGGVWLGKAIEAAEKAVVMKEIENKTDVII